jgi:hypothetical protein
LHPHCEAGIAASGAASLGTKFSSLFQCIDEPWRLAHKFYPCTERILDNDLSAAEMRPFRDTDSIRFVTVWPQARQKAVEITLSVFTSLQAVR